MKFHLKHSLTIIIVLNLVIMIVGCTKYSGDKKNVNKYDSIVSKHMRKKAHVLFQPCYDELLDEKNIGMPLDSIIQRFGKASAYEVRHDTLFLTYNFSFTPPDSYTVSCLNGKKTVNALWLAAIYFTFIDERLHSFYSNVYK